MKYKFTDTANKRATIVYSGMFIGMFLFALILIPPLKALEIIFGCFAITFGLIFLVVGVVKMSEWVERG